MTDLPPPPPPDRWPTAGRPTAPGGPDNPRLLPNRRVHLVAAAVERAEAQRAELEAEMARTGQQDALLVAEVTAHRSPDGGAWTESTWIQGRTTVLAEVDVVVLRTVPAHVDGHPHSLALRWDVVARVCGAGCWQPIAGLDPPRWITRRWPSAEEGRVLEALSLPDHPAAD